MIQPADIPGLFNVVLKDGRELNDVTMGQVHQFVGEGLLESHPYPNPPDERALLDDCIVMRGCPAQLHLKDCPEHPAPLHQEAPHR